MTSFREQWTDYECCDDSLIWFGGIDLSQELPRLVRRLRRDLLSWDGKAMALLQITPFFRTIGWSFETKLHKVSYVSYGREDHFDLP